MSQLNFSLLISYVNQKNTKEREIKMFDVGAKPEQISYVEELLKTANFGRRGEFDGNYDQQLTGILAQTIVADLIGQPRPVDNNKADGGVDFIINGKTVDLKTMGRTVPMKETFVHNFYGSQAKFDTEVLMFSSFNKRTKVLTICGWLTKEDFMKKADHFPQGTKRYRDNGTYMTVRGKAGNYEIQQALLNSLNSVDEINKNI